MSSDTGMILGIALGLSLMVFTFWPEKHAAVQRQKTRLDFLEELKEQIYLNLRDLNFEFQAGKYPQEDYEAQRAILEKEAAVVLAEMDELQRSERQRSENREQRSEKPGSGGFAGAGKI